MNYYSNQNINGNSVEFVIENNDVSFFVNGSYKYKVNDSKIGISRFLVKELKYAKSKGSFLCCIPFEDGMEDYRGKIFKKLGFTKIFGIYYWVNPKLLISFSLICLLVGGYKSIEPQSSIHQSQCIEYDCF